MTRVLALAVALAAGAACARAEEPILGAFFNASRLRDRTALQRLATVSFDPATQGIITSFSITGVVPRQAGGPEAKEVAISAPVQLPGGEIREEQLVVTLEHDVSGAVSGVAGRWMVTAIRDAAGSPSSPPR